MNKHLKKGYIISFDDLVVASFVSGAEATTLPMAIFSSIKFGLTPEINALATIIIGGLTVILLGAALYLRKKKDTSPLLLEN